LKGWQGEAEQLHGVDNHENTVGIIFSMKPLMPLLLVLGLVKEIEDFVQVYEKSLHQIIEPVS
jgi:hypothetical protein